MTPRTRRDALRASAAVGATAIVGCLGLTRSSNRPSIDDSRTLTGWTHEQCLPSRIGHRDDRSTGSSLSGVVETTVLSDRRFSATPAAADGILFVADTAGQVTALDVAGSEVTSAWHRSLDGRVSTGLTLADGRLFVPGDDGTVRAVDAYSGEDLWTFTHPLVAARDDARMVPQAPTVGDGQLFVAFRGTGERNLFALSVADGDEEWSATTPGLPATPVLDSVLVTGDAAYSRRGDQLWTNPLVTEHVDPTVTGTAVREGAVSVVSYVSGPNSPGVLQAFALDGGTERWRSSLSEEPLSLLSAADRQVFVGGQAHALADGTRRWQSFGPSHVCPAVVDGTVVAGDETGRIVGLDADDGEEQWAATVGNEPTAGVVFHRGYAVVGTRRGIHLIA